MNGGGGAFNTENLDPKISYFTREWGDNVDDWNSHNSPSRVNRGWGEVPMLIQAQGYAKNDYQLTSYDGLYRTTRQHMGGCLWHSFDHQREAIIQIRSTEASWTPSDNLSYLIICSVPSVLPNPTRN